MPIEPEFSDDEDERLVEAIELVMPMTLPVSSNSGPPEFPGLIAASLSLDHIPSGFPMAMTSWPVASVPESPS